MGGWGMVRAHITIDKPALPYNRGNGEKSVCRRTSTPGLPNIGPSDQKWLKSRLQAIRPRFGGYHIIFCGQMRWQSFVIGRAFFFLKKNSYLPSWSGRSIAL